MILEIILSVFLVTVLLLNFLVLIVTYSNQTTKLCPFCRVFSLTYIGNIMGGFSLFFSDILQHINEDKHEYHGKDELLNLDHYFFLYMGVTLNMCGIVSFTYVRYRFLKCHMRPPHNESMYKVFLKYMLPQFVLAILIAGTIVTLQHLLNSNLISYSLLLTFIPIILVIIVNIILTTHLQSQAKLGNVLKQRASLKKLRRAQKFIFLTACFQLVYLVAVVSTFFVCIYHKHSLNKNYELTFWTIRVLFFLMFTLEAKMFLHQIPEGRKTIKRALTTVFSKKDPTNETTISMALSSPMNTKSIRV